MARPLALEQSWSSGIAHDSAAMRGGRAGDRMMVMQGGRSSPWRRSALSAVLLVVAMGLPSRAQDADQRAPEEKQPNAPAASPLVPDEPPPLNLGGSDRSEPGPPDGKRVPAGHWSGYAHAIQQAVMTALTANSKTRIAPFDVEYEMWIDPKGHVTRVQLVKPSGNAGLDAALRNEVLSRLTLPEPGNDMPMPVKGHITARAQD